MVESHAVPAVGQRDRSYQNNHYGDVHHSTCPSHPLAPNDGRRTSLIGPGFLTGTGPAAPNARAEVWHRHPGLPDPHA